MQLIALTYAAAFVAFDTDRALPMELPNELLFALPVGLHALIRALRLRSRGLSAALVRGFAEALATAAALVSVALLLRAGIRPLEANGRPVPFLAQALAPVLDALGFKAFASGTNLFAVGRDDLLKIAMGVDKLALLPLLFALASAWFVQPKLWQPRHAALVCAGFVGVLLARLTVASVVILQNPKLLSSGKGAALLEGFGSRFIDLGAAFLLILLVRWATSSAEPVDALGDVSTEPSPGLKVAPQLRSPLRAAAVAGLLGLSWSLYQLDLPGEHKDGLLVFDDAHADSWGRSDRQMNTDWYGDYSTYNLNSAVEWLGQHYPTAVNQDRDLDDGLLDETSVLLLKTPSKPFSQAEIDAIEAWVRAGGGLLAIGDHTDLHGMNTHLNAVLAPYGLRFNFDAVSDAATGAFNGYEPKGYEAVPSFLSRVTDLEFMTGCSIQTHNWPRWAMLGERCSRDAGDYANGSNFGKRRSDPASTIGPAVLAAGVTHGRGRVLAISDGTIFSGFSLFKRDHDTLLLDGVAWLYRESGGSGRHWMMGLAGLSALLALAAMRGSSLRLSLAFSAPLLLGGLSATHAMHAAAYAPAPPVESQTRAVLLWEGGICAVPPSLGSIGSLKPEHAFDTLFTNIARAGVWPSLAQTYSDLLKEDPAVAFVINPVWSPPADYLSEVRAWVTNGGHLVLLDRPDAPAERTSLAEYLSALELPALTPTANVGWLDPQPAPPKPWTLWETESDQRWHRAEFGQGCVWVSLGSTDYSRDGIGHSFTLPSEVQRARLEDIYRILDRATPFSVEDRRTYDLLLETQGA